MQKRDLVLMGDDIVKSAQIAEVSYDRSIINTVLEVFEKQFSNPQASVTFRTTTKDAEKRGLNVRYVDVWSPHDPFLMATENGLIAETGHPIDDLYPEIKAKCPIMGCGIDFGAAKGFEKIWPYFPPHMPVPIENVYSITSFPDSVKNSSYFFSKFGLDKITLAGIDYPKRSTNIYFMTNSIGKFSTERVTEMINELGFRVPSSKLIALCTKAMLSYCTFTWDSPRIERLCFTILAHDPSEVPVHLHPVLENYTLRSPVLGEKRKFIYCITLAHNGDYIKIENDYSSSMVDILAAWSPN